MLTCILLLTYKSPNQSVPGIFKLVEVNSGCDYVFAPFRTWLVGATRHPVRTGDLAGRGEPPTAASVRLAGRDFIVMSQVSPVRWQPNREVSWKIPGFGRRCSFVYSNHNYHILSVS